MIFQQLTQQLKTLTHLLIQLDDEQYTHQIIHLGNASIGGHTRHIIELIQCANDGYMSGTVDYFNRKRDLNLEQNLHFAIQKLNELEGKISKTDKELNLYVGEAENGLMMNVSTTYFREIVYNMEHTIHHLALIKVALIEQELNLVDDNFGIAYSTIKFKAILSEKNQ